MTYKTFELLIAWGDFSKWVSILAVDADAAFADVCEMHAETPRLVCRKLREGQL